ncbi:MAG: serine/threonine-protein kinase [Planctomycetota bacterium]
MNPSDRERVKDLLAQAARLEPQRRVAFIETAAGNAEIAAEAIELLHTLDDSVFMSAPTGAGFDEAPALHREGPGAKIGRYKLLQLVGEGGFGAVFMAEQTEPVHRRVALKIIKAGMDTKQVIARFEAERQALALMDHPNIARVLDAGATDGGRPYFVMELVRGEPVTRYCDRERLPVRQRLELFRDVCNAVQHAHQKGVIHRDLKPSNVLVTVADGEPLPKVIDFGIAKATAGRLTDKTLFTEMHQLIGTPEYMSPEQAEVSGVDIDTRSDVYSLGVLLYELLAGSTPLKHARLRSTPLVEIQRLIREEEPLRPSLWLATLASPSGTGRFRTPLFVAGDEADSSAMEIARCRRSEPSVLSKALRGDLDWIVMKCLEKDRRRRYATANALADDIGLYLANQPVSAIPPSTRYKLRKFVRRNRTLVLAGVAIATVLLLGVIGTTIGLVWAVRERRQAEEQRTIAQASAVVARIEADRADREADQARTVNEFMRGLLGSATPQNKGAEARLIDVLASASANTSRRFKGLPLQEAQLRDLLGQIYADLSMWPEAKAEYVMALTLWREHADPDDPRALSTQSGYAVVASNLGHTNEAEQMLAELIPRMERVVGPDDPKTLAVQVRVAQTHLGRGRVDEAERILLGLRVHPRLADDDAIQTQILRGLVWANRFRAFNGDRAQHAATLSLGEPLAREWFERSMRRYGLDSVRTLDAQVRLAEIVSSQGESQAAAEMCRAVLEISAERFGECHDVRVFAMTQLSQELAHLGEAQEPAELRLRALACLRQKVAAGSPALLGDISDTLRFLERVGRSKEGESLARELTAAMQNIGGGHGDLVFGSELYVARFVSMQNRLDEAEPIFESLIARQSQADRDERARLHLFFGGHLVRRKNFEVAEQHLITAVELIEDIRLGTWDTHPDDVILGFIDLYEAWNKPDKVEEYQRLRTEVTNTSARTKRTK